MNFDFLSTVIEMIAKSLKEHGLIKTCYALMGFCAFIGFLILCYKLPEIILAIKA